MSKKTKKEAREQEREKKRVAKANRKKPNKFSSAAQTASKRSSQKTKNPTSHALWLEYKKQRNLRNKQKKTNVEVGNLPQRQRVLNEKEAKRIKGGGGAAGGVVMRPGLLSHNIGEEIPSKR